MELQTHPRWLKCHRKHDSTIHTIAFSEVELLDCLNTCCQNLRCASCRWRFWSVNVFETEPKFASIHVIFVAKIFGFKLGIEGRQSTWTGWWWWHWKKSVQQSLEAWPYKRECRGHNPMKKSVTTDVACSIGKLYVHTVDDSVQCIDEHKRKTRRDEINTSCCCYKSSEVAESSGAVQHLGSQETKRSTGSQDTQKATERKRQIVRAHQSGL